MPALLLNYFGQSALLLGNPASVSNPFFLMVPEWGRLPLVGLATCATIIASQAVISGAFSVTQQAVQLGFLPRIKINHTSASAAGQIYIPLVNWGLLGMVILLVVSFGTSSALASAYGIAVTGTMFITTCMMGVLVVTVVLDPNANVLEVRPMRVPSQAPETLALVRAMLRAANLPVPQQLPSSAFKAGKIEFNETYLFTDAMTYQIRSVTEGQAGE